MAGARGSAHRQLVSRLFRRRNRRRRAAGAWRGRLSGRLARGLGIALGLGLVAGVWPVLRAAMSRHPYFTVREVTVRGHHHLRPDDVRAAAGIVPGMSIWGVDRRAAEERLRARPWVRTASVRRELPGRVVIQLREERPVAILSLADGGSAPALYFVAAHGRVFAPVGADDGRDFPYLTGLGRADLEGAEASGSRAVRRTLALLRQVAHGSGGVEAVSEIHIDRAHGLTLLPTKPRVPIELGWGGFTTKLQRLPRVLALWNGREAEIVGVSLVFDGEVLVRTRAVRAAST